MMTKQELQRNGSVD